MKDLTVQDRYLIHAICILAQPYKGLKIPTERGAIPWIETASLLNCPSSDVKTFRWIEKMKHCRCQPANESFGNISKNYIQIWINPVFTPVCAKAKSLETITSHVQHDLAFEAFRSSSKHFQCGNCEQERAGGRGVKLPSLSHINTLTAATAKSASTLFVAHRAIFHFLLLFLLVTPAVFSINNNDSLALTTRHVHQPWLLFFRFFFWWSRHFRYHDDESMGVARGEHPAMSATYGNLWGWLTSTALGKNEAIPLMLAAQHWGNLGYSHTNSSAKSRSDAVKWGGTHCVTA